VLAIDKYACLKCLRQATEIVPINEKYFAIGDNRLLAIDDQNVLKPQISFYTTRFILHVRHEYYMLSKLPWDYEKKDLIMLCSECHNILHEEIEVPVYLDERKILLDNLTECPRCNGYGYIENYNHLQGGMCFRCHGAKYLELANAVFTGSVFRF